MYVYTAVYTVTDTTHSVLGEVPHPWLMCAVVACGPASQPAASQQPAAHASSGLLQHDVRHDKLGWRPRTT
jgi:hypothetical protein